MNSVAAVKDQTNICFADAAEIVKATELKKNLSVYRNSITYEAKGGMLKPLYSDYETHDSLNPSCGIIDEFHAHKDSGMFADSALTRGGFGQHGSQSSGK